MIAEKLETIPNVLNSMDSECPRPENHHRSTNSDKGLHLDAKLINVFSKKVIQYFLSPDLFAELGQLLSPKGKMDAAKKTSIKFSFPKSEKPLVNSEAEINLKWLFQRKMFFHQKSYWTKTCGRISRSSLIINNFGSLIFNFQKRSFLFWQAIILIRKLVFITKSYNNDLMSPFFN